jgi:acetyltransferase-like isoleucine patch superfamily enzyme
MPVVFLNEDPRLARYAIGEHSYADEELEVVSFGEGSMLHIGKYCSIARGVTILLGGEHRPDWVTTYPFSALRADARHHIGHPRTKGDVVIGHDVWIGTRSLILSGVSIGDGAVLGAGSVVTKDVAPYAIVAGNPARQVRERFSQAQREALLEIAWWNWPEDKVRDAWPLLLSSAIDEFIATYAHAS